MTGDGRQVAPREPRGPLERRSRDLGAVAKSRIDRALRDSTWMLAGILRAGLGVLVGFLVSGLAIWVLTPYLWTITAPIAFGFVTVFTALSAIVFTRLPLFRALDKFTSAEQREIERAQDLLALKLDKVREQEKVLVQLGTTAAAIEEKLVPQIEEAYRVFYATLDRVFAETRALPEGASQGEDKPDGSVE